MGTGQAADVSGLMELRESPEMTQTCSVSSTMPGSLRLTTPASTTGSSPGCSTTMSLDTEPTSGWEPSLGSDTVRTLLENGSGLTRTRLFSGSTGPRASPTTCTGSTAWV